MSNMTNITFTRDQAYVATAVVKRVDNFTSTENNMLIDMIDKVNDVEAYVTDLERKIITLKTDIEIMKQKDKL